tara:strand:- start:6383 stop:6637 length:255 start_codon:yes stop_codon:yes gene_type:complete
MGIESNQRRKKCNIDCECKDTGFVEVHNFGLFCSQAKTIAIVCNGPMGEAINKGRSPAKRSPVYDPDTMYLVGEVIPKMQKQMF